MKEKKIRAYNKALAVVNSCTNLLQLDAAEVFVGLYKRLFSVHEKEMFHLYFLIEERRRLLEDN